MHAIGFHHEQNRSDRDNYVAIQWGNIQSGWSSQFNKNSYTLNQQGTYDYSSVMHYGAYVRHNTLRTCFESNKFVINCKDSHKTPLELYDF